MNMMPPKTISPAVSSSAALDLRQKGQFVCRWCGKTVRYSPAIGTKHRNHCPFCLWSLHVDDRTSGDRTSECRALMQPIGITLKHEGKDKFTGKPKYGDVMIVHTCTACGKININRIASDDNTDKVLEILDRSPALPSPLKARLDRVGIVLVHKDHRTHIIQRIFGNTSHPNHTG